MPEQYIVQAGDCIASIAFERGFFPDTIWNHPDNASLKQARKDPHVLLPGDVVSILDKRVVEIGKPAGKRHRFRRKGVPHELQLRFADWKDNPIANMDADIQVDGILSTGTTDGDGLLKIGIPPGARNVKVRFASGYEYSLRLGHLDPVSEPAGLQQRLQNLGFYSGALHGRMDAMTTDAVKRFQAAEGLDVTGNPDQGTRDLLVTRNGS